MLVPAVLILAIGSVADIDLALADRAFDAARGQFPLRHAWLTERFSHVILKRLSIALGGAMLALAAWDWVARRPVNLLLRFQLRVVALSALLVPLACSALKQISSSHCPWDLQRYGGKAPYIRVLEQFPDGAAYGHCMPAGHASSTLWMISLALFLLPKHPRLATAAFMSLLALGFAVGWMQQLRGAHFLTHTLWSMWIAVTLVGVLALALDRPGEGAPFTCQAT